MFRAIAAFAVASLFAFATFDAAAAHPKMGTIQPNLGKTTSEFSAKKHRRHYRAAHHRLRRDPGPRDSFVAQCDDRYCTVASGPRQPESARERHGRAYTWDSGTVVGGRPRGCPHAFCGCEASLYKFGRIIPTLNLAYNWIRKFPRTSPAPGMAAARSGHVMILMSHVDGNNWLVHDGNSGRHKTREHVRSISGYVIVNPNAQLASR